MELARSIQRLLIGEGRQPVRLAGFLSLGRRLLFWLLGFNGRDLPAAGSRLQGLALVVTLLLSPARIIFKSVLPCVPSISDDNQNHSSRCLQQGSPHHPFESGYAIPLNSAKRPIVIALGWYKEFQ